MLTLQIDIRNTTGKSVAMRKTLQIWTDEIKIENRRENGSRSCLARIICSISDDLPILSKKNELESEGRLLNDHHASA